MSRHDLPALHRLALAVIAPGVHESLLRVFGLVDRNTLPSLSYLSGKHRARSGMVGHERHQPVRLFNYQQISEQQTAPAISERRLVQTVVALP